MAGDQVLDVLRQHQAELNQPEVSRLLLFGSVAHNEAHPGSDVAFLVEFSRPVGLFGLAALQLRLQDLLGCPLDVGTLDSLKPRLRASSLAESVSVA